MSQTDVLFEQPVSAPDEVSAAPADAALSKPPAGKTFFAVVNANGTLARSADATSAQNLGSGQYEVIFKFDVTSCVYVACIGSAATSGVEPTGQITVVGRSGKPNGVFIATADSTGNFADRGFHLIVRS